MNTPYTLFGESFQESQGAMMARVFHAVLSRHPDLLPEALRKFPCLSAIDYTRDPEALRTAPSAFLNRRTFTVGGQRVCIGTSYPLAGKRALISRLFQLCGEDESQFVLLDPDAEEQSAVQRGRTNSGRQDIQYQWLDQTYRSTQAEMMYHVFQEMMIRTPGLADWAAEHLGCVSRTDYAQAKERGEPVPSGFRSCRMVEADGRRLCVGSS